MLVREAVEVKVAGRVPAQDEEWFIADEVYAVFYPAGSAEGLVFYPPAEVDASAPRPRNAMMGAGL